MKIKGIKKASGYTENYPPYSGKRVDLFIDLNTGEVWGEFIHGDNTWMEFRDPAIHRFASTTRHMTMREIRERAETFLAENALYHDAQ